MRHICVSSLQKGILLSEFTYIVSSVLLLQMSLRWAKKFTSSLPKITGCAEGPSRHLLEINYASTIFWFFTKLSKGAKAQTTRLNSTAKHHPQLHSGIWSGHVMHGKSRHASWASLKERVHKTRSSWSRSSIWPGITSWWEKPIPFPWGQLLS